MKSQTLISFLVYVLAGSAWAMPERVLILGDSLTAGSFVREDQSYPYLLQQRLIEEGQLDVTLVPAGIYGKKTKDAQTRLQKHLREDTELTALMLVLGANDGLRGRGIEIVKSNLVGTILLAQSRGLDVLLVGMKLPLVYPEKYRLAFEKMYSDIATETQVSFLPFLLEGVGGHPELNLPDTLHPNAAGYRVVAKHVYPYLIEFLGLR